MSETPRERALVAVGYGGLYVFLAYEGKALEFEMEYSYSPNDVIGDGAFPERIGIYYWEGTPVMEGGGDTWMGKEEPELVWKDEVIRLANLGDLEEMGLGRLVL